MKIDDGILVFCNEAGGMDGDTARNDPKASHRRFAI